MLGSIYLGFLSTATAGFLIRKEIIHWRELHGAYESFDNAKTLVETLTVAIVFIFDLLKDTTKYLLIALALSLVSLPLFVWALAKPCRWKAYALLLIGLGANWCGISPPEALAKHLADDKYSLVLGTLITIGLVYMVTSIIQLTVAEPGWYFDDDIKERQEEALQRAQKGGFRLTLDRVKRFVVENPSSISGDFESFWRALPHKERQQFLGVWSVISVMSQDGDTTDEKLKNIGKHLSGIWDSSYYEKTLDHSDSSIRELLEADSQ
jgi:hypothetical protein